jgi:hypothetical protein
MNLAWWLERSTWEHPDNAAAIDGLDGLLVTFAELNTLAARLGNVLREHFRVVEDTEVPRTAKRTKQHSRMRDQITGVVVKDEDGVTTLGALQTAVGRR